MRFITGILLAVAINACAVATPWSTSEQFKKGGKWTDPTSGKYKKMPIENVTSMCAYRPHPLAPGYYAIKLTNLKTDKEHVFICEEVNKEQKK